MDKKILSTLVPPSLRGYRRAYLWPDILAGLTLAAVAIPEVMGHTSISRTPLATGLYTILLPLAIFALLGASRTLVVGGDSATAAAMAAGLIALGASTAGDPGSERWVVLCSLTALMTGLFLVIARLLKLGMIGDFLSGAALVGLFSGIGIQVATGQIPALLGLKSTDGSWFDTQVAWVTSLEKISWPTVAFGAATIGVIVAGKLFAPKLPGSLIAVVGLLTASIMLGAATDGVSVIGKVDGGLPALTFPAGITWADAIAVIPTALSCTLLVIAQSAATSRKVALAAGERADVNRDLVGLSAANVAAAFSGTFVVNGSPTKTQILEQARGRTQVANLVVVAATALVLTFLTGLLADLPHAVLAGVVFMIGVSLIDIRSLVRLVRRSPTEFVVATSTMLTAFLVGISAAIILAIVLSLITVIARQYRAPADVLVPQTGGGYTYQAAHSGIQSAPGLIVFRYGADLFFANANAFTDTVEDVVASAPDPVRWLILDTSSISNIDYAASANVIDLLHYLGGRGVHVAFARPAPAIMASLQKYGLAGPLRGVQVFTDLDAAIAAFHADTSTTTTTTTTTKNGKS